MKQYLYEFWLFGLKQAYACLFGGFLLFIMFASRIYYPFETLHRYDFIFIAAIMFQLILLLFKLETPREALVIVVFHVIATLMELFKTSDSIASWHYPEQYYFGIANVPLFTGFMYSAVGSYIARIWRIFDFKFTHYPNIKVTIILVSVIYLNFFSHHFIIELRWALLLVTAFFFGRTTIHFKVSNNTRKMPLLLGWLLVAIFIWFAENLATYANIWIYPNQIDHWQMVSVAKLSSWYLLMMLSFVLISIINTTHAGTTTK